jgi:cation diffusion facilitator CzcD-associated flavoprotein CzcO
MSGAVSTVEHYEVVVIGARQAGLATGQFLS